jgi:hypothetical protein
MENNGRDLYYDLIVNGHKFQTPDRFVTGKDVLVIAGFSPDHPFEILMKLHGNEFEPVELNEKKDLKEGGIEQFEVKQVEPLTIDIDDDTYTVPECFMTPVQILDLKKYKPEAYYLKQILAHKEITYKDDEQHVIAIHCGMKFSTCKKASTPVS